MNPSTTIGLLSGMVICVACLCALLMGGPAWLAGIEAEVTLKFIEAVVLLLIGERMWRPSKKELIGSQL